jgi:hypothetical protein
MNESRTMANEQRIQVRRDTLANFVAAGVVPKNGEPIAIVDPATGRAVSYVIGDGVSTVDRLPALSKGDPGPQGLPGTNTASNDTQSAAFIADPATQTRAALDLRYGAHLLTRGLGVLLAALAARNTTACNIVFTGSSTTAGTGASDEAHSFVNVLAGQIQVAYPSSSATEAAVVKSTTADFGTISTSPGVHAYNAGVGGTASDTYLPDTAAQKIAALSPAAVMHMVGSNDFSLNMPPATYKSNVVGRIALLKSLMTKPCVHILVQPYERYDSSTHTYPWSQYGDALRAIAAADPDNVVFLDISSAYYVSGIPGADPFGLMYTDKVHQIDTGHALMADLLGRALGVGRRQATVQAPTGRGVATDTFSRPDNPVIGSSTETGAKTWAGIVGQSGAAIAAGDVLVQSGAAGPKAAGVGATGFVFVDSGGSDHVLDGTLAALGSGPGNQGGGFAVRVSSDGGGIWLSTRVNSSTAGWALYEAVGGGSTSLLAQFTTALPAVGDRVKVVASGSTVTAFVNGVQVMQAPTQRTGRGAGICVHPSGTASRYDSIVVAS